MHGVMKTKEINVSETKIGKILDKMNPEAQRNRQNIAGRLLNPKVCNAEYFGHKFTIKITIRMTNWECLELLMCVLKMNFLVAGFNKNNYDYSFKIPLKIIV